MVTDASAEKPGLYIQHVAAKDYCKNFIIFIFLFIHLLIYLYYCLCDVLFFCENLNKNV